MPKRQNLNISNLYLDLRNPRYEEQRSQKDAINTIAKEQKTKLVLLLQDILKNGVNPSDIPIVMLESGKDRTYIVLEGNRRLAALKIFKKPNILEDKRLKQQYQKLHDKYKDTIKTIECLVVDSREEADKWIERKHEGEMSGIGTVRWTSVQKDRFLLNKSGKDSIVLQLIDFLRRFANSDAELAEFLGKMKPTNLFRLLSTPQVRVRLGLDYNSGLYSSRLIPEEVLKGLKSVVRRLADENFNVRIIYHKEDRISFIDSISTEELPDLSKKAAKIWSLNDFKGSDDQPDESVSKSDKKTDDSSSQVSSNSSNNKSQKRETFIPRDFTLRINNERINRLFLELQGISPFSFPNVCAVMLRVFVELSVDSFLETFSLLKNDAITGSQDSRDLKQKTKAVIQKLESLQFMDTTLAKGIKTQITQNHSILGIDTLNAYVHNNMFNPIPETLILSWNNIQPFIKALWDAIEDNTEK